MYAYTNVRDKESVNKWYCVREHFLLKGNAMCCIVAILGLSLSKLILEGIVYCLQEAGKISFMVLLSVVCNKNLYLG